MRIRNAKLPMKMLSMPNTYDLADPTFDSPGHVDLLLGITVYTHILRDKAIKIGTLALVETALGWTVSGIATQESPNFYQDS